MSLTPEERQALQLIHQMPRYPHQLPVELRNSVAKLRSLGLVWVKGACLYATDAGKAWLKLDRLDE